MIEENRGPSFFLSRPFSPVTTIAVSALIAVYAFAAQAQSGRRLPKGVAPVPEAAPEPKRSPKSDADEKAKVQVILGINGRDTSFNVPLYFYDSVLQACADKLREAPSIKLNVSGRDMNRAEAIRLAKAQKEAFVAMLELRTDGTGAARTNSNNYDEFYVEYFVFAPETGKNITSGRAYQRVYQNKGVIMGPRTSGRTSSVYAEQLLKQAARDAAERIMSALHVVLPNGKHFLNLGYQHLAPHPDRYDRSGSDTFRRSRVV